MTKTLMFAAAMATAIVAPLSAEAATATGWAKNVVPTADGGFMMGNPKAPAHVIEYGSLTCPACRQFNTTEKPKLIAKYINSGKVKYEYRSFLIHGAPDYMSSLMAYCLPASRYFTWVDVIYNEFGDWTGGFKNVTDADQAAAQKMKPQEALIFLADKGGFDDFWRKKGIPKATYDKCMADPVNFTKLANVYKTAAEKWQISGTPTFIVNGKKLENALTFDHLDAQLKKIVK